MLAKNICKTSVCCLILHLVTLTLFSQTSITGSTCVQAGVSYQYTISGNWNQNTAMSWSVTGGAITNPPASGTPKPNIFVTWSSSGTVSLISGIGNASIIVSVSAALSGGVLSNSAQTITYNTAPATINSTTSASGGSCSPSYSYQWQKSTDNVNFSDLSGQTGLTLNFLSPLTIT